MSLWSTHVPLVVVVVNYFKYVLISAWPIKAKFHVETPKEGGTKVYINGPGHMTKMAATPIYGKNLQKYSPPDPEVL